jgi:hypothetical protein
LICVFFDINITFLEILVSHLLWAILLIKYSIIKINIVLVDEIYIWWIFLVKLTNISLEIEWIILTLWFAIMINLILIKRVRIFISLFRLRSKIKWIFLLSKNISLLVLLKISAIKILFIILHVLKIYCWVLIRLKCKKMNIFYN